MKNLRGRFAGRVVASFCSSILGKLTIVALVFGVVLASIPPAQAQDDEQIAAIDLTQLRRIGGTNLVPYEVTVVSERALEAVLEIRLNEQNLAWEFPLALAANSEISQLVAIPAQNDRVGQVTVNLLVDGTSVADIDEFGNQPDSGTEFAAGLLGIARVDPEIIVVPAVGSASILEIDDLRILSALDIVVASPEALNALTAAEQGELFTWVGTGGQLAVADEPGTIDALLPEEWQGSGTTVSAGVGELTFVGFDWAAALPPPPSSGINGEMVNQFVGGDQALVADGGFRIPSLRNLSLILVVYLFVVGPLAFLLVGKSKRQEVIWVVVPVLAVVFGVGVIVAGQFFNNGRSDAYASIVTVTPAGAEVNSTLLLASSGRQTVELPAGWIPLSNGSGSNDGFSLGSGSDVTLRPSRTTTEVSFDIDSGSAGLARVQGRIADVAMPFSFTDLAIAGDELTGVLTNSSGSNLEDVTVLVGPDEVHVDSLDNGATMDISIDLDARPGVFAPELRLWGANQNGFDDFGFNGGFNEIDDETVDSAVNGAAWLTWRLENLGSSVSDGVITAVGWTTERTEFSLVGGRGRTALVQHQELPANDGEATVGEIRTLRSVTPVWEDFDNFNSGFGEGISTTFVRPMGSSTDQLALETDDQVTEVAFWLEGEWRYVELEENTDSVTIPEAAWVNDRLSVLYGLGGFGPSSDAAQQRLTASENGRLEAALLPPGEQSPRQANFDEEAFGPAFEEPEVFLGNETLLERASREDVSFDESGDVGETYDAWVILLEPGDEVQAVMRSNRIDSLLHAVGPDGSLITENDDGPNMGLDSLIEFTADEWGLYVIETRPLFSDFNNAYEVTIDISTDSPDGDFEWNATGATATDGDEWPIRVANGDQLAIEVDEDSGVALTLLGPDGESFAESGESDTTINVVADQDGTYVVVVTGNDDSNSESYQLNVSVGGS